MICLGSPQISPTALQAEAAELRAVEWFRQYFLARFPTGIVISQLGFMGRTTSPGASPTPMRMPGQPRLNQILDALSEDFRNWSKARGYRKCDALGIANDGFNAELLEIAGWIRAIAGILAVAAVIAAIIALIDPVPGDEVAAACFAAALMRVALARGM